jgi:hypothetical protein
LYVVGAFAAMSGAVTSAPVSMTAIVIALAARVTASGTASKRAAPYCHCTTWPVGPIASAGSV